MQNDSFLSRINVVLVMTYGSLVFVLLFVFVKRQIMRLAMKSRRGPHAPLGHNAPKELKQEIEAKLSEVQKIHFEPRLLSPDDDRLKLREQTASYDFLYRMKALDAIRDADFPFRELGGSSAAVTGKRFRSWLLQLRNSSCELGDDQSAVIDSVLDGYNSARHGSEAFGEAEFLKYKEALTELASLVKSHRSTNPSQQQQSAAKDLNASPSSSGPSSPGPSSSGPSSPGPSSSGPSSSGPSSPTQSTYLTSGFQQRSKRPRTFLELKKFKDNYNTLDSTL